LRRTEIDDFHRSGRLPIDQIDDKILFLLHTFPFRAVRTLAEPLSVGPSTILDHLGDSLGLKRHRFRWLPYELK
jgi:hypothetical protein